MGNPWAALKWYAKRKEEVRCLEMWVGHKLPLEQADGEKRTDSA